MVEDFQTFFVILILEFVIQMTCLFVFEARLGAVMVLCRKHWTGSKFFVVFLEVVHLKIVFYLEEWS